MSELPVIRIDVNEMPKVSEQLFESMLSSFQIIITENGKDVAITVPYKEYETMQEVVKLGEPNKHEKL